MEPLEELETRLREIVDLRSAAAVLEWDQNTYMPPEGAAARGRQIATLQRLAHEKLSDARVGRLLETLEPWARERADDDPGACLVRMTRLDFDRATRVPPAFTARFADHVARTWNVWTKARPADDFAMVRPLLERTLEMSRELAGFFPGATHVADPLIDQMDPGMTAASVRALFSALRAELVPLARDILSQPAADDACLKQAFPEEAQLAFGGEIIRAIGYDFSRGRQDKTHHPFMTRFSWGDVRITTRVKERDLGEALFSTVHEAGHALYELGTARELDGLPIGEGASAGIHESQSRLWENVVGRSRPFWHHFFPKLQAAFPSQLSGISETTFYRAINKVARSLIRTDADEVTYNLHVMIRFDLELEMLEGKLAVRDLPEAWRARYQSDLGVSSPTDRDGCLQDVHWFGGQIGGVFQGYTIGNVLAAQLWEAALDQHPDLPEEHARGEFGTLRAFLVERLHRHGRKHLAPAIIEQATGHPLTIEPYLGYLKGKYGELYGL